MINEPAGPNCLLSLAEAYELASVHTKVRLSTYLLQPCIPSGESQLARRTRQHWQVLHEALQQETALIHVLLERVNRS